MRLRLVAILLSLSVPFGLTACGGDESVDEVLKATFGPNKPIKSGKLDLNLALDLKGVQNLEGPISLGLKGPFQSNGASTLPDFDFNLAVDAGGQSFSAGAVSTGEAGFLKFQGQSFDIGKELYDQFRTGYQQSQKNQPKNAKGPSFESLGIEPLGWLDNAEEAGEEQVGGTDTIHIKADVDVKGFLDDVSKLLDRAKGLNIQGAGQVPGGLSVKQRDQIVKSVKSAKIDLWSGKDDKTLRKIAIVVELDVPDDARADVGGLTSGRIAFGFTIADLNEKQAIKAPANASPLSELTAALGQLGIGGGGSANGTTPPATTTPPPATPPPATPPAGATPPPSSSAPADYLECLQKAGQDVAKVQQCAALLN